MDERNNTWVWVIGLVVVLLIGLGVWWYVGGMTPTTTDGTATTTPNGTATTTGNTPAVTTENRTGSTVAAVVAGLSGSSQFSALLAASGVSLSGAGPYTVFVPTDSAVSATAALNGMTAAQKKRLVQYHIVTGKMLDLDAVSSGNHMALSKDALNFNVNAQTKIAYVGDGYAVRQYRASNGIVYVISAVLIPPQTPSVNGNTGTPVPTQ